MKQSCVSGCTRLWAGGGNPDLISSLNHLGTRVNGAEPWLYADKHGLKNGSPKRWNLSLK